MEIKIAKNKNELGVKAAKLGADLIRKAIAKNGKAKAVENVANGDVTPQILQQHKSTYLYLNKESSFLINKTNKT